MHVRTPLTLVLLANDRHARAGRGARQQGEKRSAAVEEYIKAAATANLKRWPS